MPDPFIFPLKTCPLGQVRDRWLCLGVWCLKSQIPSTKLQINLKLQIPNRFNAQRRRLRRVSDCFFVWDFEFRSLLFVCFLGFVIWNFNKSMNFQQSKSPLGITKALSFGPGLLLVQV
jgi:hypothetical protein